MAEAVVRVKVIGDNLQFVQDMEKTRKSVDGVRGSVDSLSKSLGAIRASAIVYLARQAMEVAERMYSFGKAVASAANDIERQANIIGISTDAFQKWQYAAKMSDISNESLGTGLKMLSKSMEEAIQGAGDGAKWFQAMGVSVKDASGNMKPLDQMMMEIASKFESWEDGPKKIAIALALFGRSGQELIPILNQGASGIQRFFNEAEKLGTIIDRDLIKKGSELEAEFKKVDSILNTIKTTLILSIMPTEKFGDALGQLLKDVRDFYSDPTIQAIFKLLSMVPAMGPGGMFLKGMGLAATGLARKEEELPGFAVSHGEEYEKTKLKKVQPPSLPEKAKGIDDALKLEQKMLEENARAWGDYADEVLNSFEKMQMDIIEDQKKTNAEIDELLKQGEQSWIESIDAKFEADFDYYNKIAELQREKNKQDEEAAKHSAEMALKAKEMMPSWKKEIAELTGNYDLMMQAEKEILQIEMDRIIRGNELTGIYKEQVEILYKQKQAIVEAQRTMNIPALVNLGAQQASIDYNRQLADQYMKLIPNALNIGQGALTGFFDNLRSGTMSAGDAFKKMADDFISNIMKMIEEIGFLIIKMEILKSLGYGTSMTGGGGMGGGSILTGLLGFGTSLIGGAASAYTPGTGPGWSTGITGVPGAPIATQKGGYFTKPTLALIGEAGPEYVIPKDKIDTIFEKETNNISNNKELSMERFFNREVDNSSDSSKILNIQRIIEKQIIEDLPKYAEGGSFLANKPTPIMVGEGGQPEFISVIPKSKIDTNDQGNQRTINIKNYFSITSPDGNISRYSQDQIAQKAAIGIQRAMRKM